MKKIGFIDSRRLKGFTLAGASALVGPQLDIEDIATQSSGSSIGLYLNYDQNGAKTGSATVAVQAIDLALKKAVIYAYNQALYMAGSGNPAVDFASALSIYIDDIGTGLGGFCGIDIGLALTNAPADRHCFIRMRNHVGTIVKDAIRIEGSHPVTNLFAFEIDHEPIVDAAVGGSSVKKLTIKIVDTTYYIPVYAS